MDDDPLKVIRHTLQSSRSEKIQSYSTVVWYALMLIIKCSKVDGKSVHQSSKITFHFNAMINAYSVSSMVASGYINTHWWLKATSSATCDVFHLIGETWARCTFFVCAYFGNSIWSQINICLWLLSQFYCLCSVAALIRLFVSCNAMLLLFVILDVAVRTIFWHWPKTWFSWNFHVHSFPV